ncbi:hypothetical protein BU16DRAFT_526642 [Lophium mytilinum]|uniref:Uncharacterized protein n=1 Tax=Lophium mytilinum TaxID=390894 RepID=A0A6A6QUC7_9PEZI|nr:hypothetical protein BU16DRAFT_526642 [Lophium mytilinum]
MQFTIAAIAALITLTTALPTESKRAGAGVTFYVLENFNNTGAHDHEVYDYNTCHNVPVALYGNVGSVAVDPGAYCRITYTADECTLHGDAFVYPPGETNLHQFKDPASGNVVDAGKLITSFLCQECTSC